MSEGTDVGSTVAGFVKEQMTVNREKKAKAAAMAAATQRKAMVVVLVAAVLIAGAAWLLYDRLQPPGFVKVLDVAENATTGTMVVTGKVKNMTPRTIAERTYVVSYFEANKAKKPVAEVPLVLKDLKSGETREWKVEVPSWHPGLRLVVQRKEAESGGT